MNILDFSHDPQLAGKLFADPSWDTWRVLLASIFGVPLTSEQLTVFQRLTGREKPPSSAVREAWIIAGRRGGKTRAAALIAVWIAARFTALRRAETALAPGERGVILFLAADRQQAGLALRYAEGLIDSVPILAAELPERQKERLVFGRVEIRTGARLNRRNAEADQFGR